LWRTRTNWDRAPPARLPTSHNAALHGIEALEGFLEREARHTDAYLVMLVAFGSDLGGQQLIEGVAVGNLFLGHLFQVHGQFVVDPFSIWYSPQLMTMFAQTFELWSAHRAAPP